MFPALIEKLMRREDLTSDEAAAAMAEVMEGRAADAQIAGAADRPRDEGRAARGDRRPGAHDARARGDAVAAATTTCSTPAAPAAIVRARSISPRAAALVVAACGVRVAKHGNRSVSSRCGSADVFEALGVASPRRRPSSSAASPRRASASSSRRRSIRRCGTPAPTRKALGVRTAFNLLGPLTNPAGATRQLVGVPRPEFTELIARALLLLGSERAWVVHGADGIDEISTTGYTKVSECRDGAVNTFYLHPADVGLAEGDAGGAPGRNAARERADHQAVLAGERGPARDIVRAQRRRGAVHRRHGVVADGRHGAGGCARSIAARPRKTLERLVALSTAEESTAGAGA